MMMKKNYFGGMLIAVLCLSLGSVYAQDEAPVASPSTVGSVDEILQREGVRRQEVLLRATKVLEDAQNLIKQGKLDDARVMIGEVVKVIPNVGEGASVYRQANNLLSAIDTNKAVVALGKKDYFNARNLAKQALQENPQNQQAAVVLNQTSQALGILLGQDAPENPAVDVKFVDNLNKVSGYIKTGRDLKSTGQYDAARQSFQQALAIDPNNMVAAREVLALQRQINQNLEVAHDSSNQERRTAVRSDWTEQYHLVDQATEAGTRGGTPISMRNNFMVSQKLRAMVIKNVNFEEATIEDAVRFLTEETRRLDTDGGNGINFLIQSDKVQRDSRPFSLKSSNMPVGEVLRYITNLAGVRYRVEEYAVFIVPFSSLDDVLVLREFPVRATFFEVDSAASSENARPIRRVITKDSGGGARPTDEIRRSLEARGVQFAEGATAIYNAATGILTVRNTQDQIDLIEELVTENQGETLQVAVQTKLLEINQTDLDSLAFNYAFTPSVPLLNQLNSSRGHAVIGTNLIGSRGLKQADGINSVINLNPDIGSAANPVNAATVPNRFAYSGVIDGNTFSALVETLSQKSGADLMVAPSIVMNDGQDGKITVAREFWFPVEFDQPQVSPNSVSINTGGGNSSNSSIAMAPTVIPAWPTQFETRPVGVVLTVKPSVTPDRKRVFLTIKPEITEFDGFINYGAQMYSTVAGYNEMGYPLQLDPPGLINSNVINQPVFSVRTVENAQLEVQDGYTMVLGGLIREDISSVEDGVPVLMDIPWIGRLFRSKAEQSVKRNLLIFVTVRILRPDGQPLNPSTGSMSNPVTTGS
ncbi:MAG: hypothetical protein LBK60_08350 [Verrucomicrobiales bacterium]|jgi:general secretion pathway protein D|nr:hypothetical protein [Verrucomicrobiales bacterium]